MQRGLTLEQYTNDNGVEFPESFSTLTRVVEEVFKALERDTPRGTIEACLDRLTKFR
ncbi:MAG: hypothetical protein H7095_05465 [Pseudopedobacter sp.]|nr:hypothetical protein [Deinococcales bacterium]